MAKRPSKSKPITKKSIGITSGEEKFTKGEFRSGSAAGTAYITGSTFARKALYYADVEGLAIFEGDIVLGTVAEIQASADAEGGNLPQFSVGISGQQFRWPNATIPFEIDANLTNQQRITDAIAHWEANTRIRFVRRTSANAAQFPDFVYFQPGSGCSSMVGRRGGRQNITLASNCSTGNTIHEIGHAVGLWHEQSREDRDTFVRIVWANIDANMQHNFSQHISDGDDLGPYDYGSIMHYPRSAFSNNGQDTIIPLQTIPSGLVLGQRNGLSQGDINGVHMMYPQVGTIKEAAKDPIRDTFKEIRKDPIRDTFKEIRKDPIRDTIKEVPKDPIRDTFKEIRKDPIFDGRDLENYTGSFTSTPGDSPFIMATPSRVSGSQGDPLDEVVNQIKEISEALMALEQQQAELLAAYETAMQDFNTLQQGR